MTLVRNVHKVYISGKYTSPTNDYNEVDGYIGVARAAAFELAKNGIQFYCPHTHSAHFDMMIPEVSYQFWMAMCLDYVRDCDAILMLPNWTNSSGAKEEKAEAESLGLPVFFTVEEAIAWAKV